MYPVELLTFYLTCTNWVQELENWICKLLLRCFSVYFDQVKAESKKCSANKKWLTMAYEIDYDWYLFQ